MFSIKKIVGAALAAMLISAVASAQPSHLQPGSALVYPLFDSAPGAGTVICVTNLNTSVEYCDETDAREGDIRLHYVYIDGETWREFDRYEYLTPGDTLCVIADKHNPEGEKGFLVITAQDPTRGNLVNFDHLIGSAIIVQSDLNFLWSYTPYAFGGLGNGGNDCDLANPDDDGDGAPDFDGTEYDMFPAAVYVDSFFQEGDTFENELTVMTTSGGDYRAEVAVLFWNNIEQKFSRSFSFTCWWTGALSEISAIATGLGGDADELGVQDIETGWMSMTPTRLVDGSGNPVGTVVPPVLGVFGQFITGQDFATGHALHYSGTLDGLELNGDLDHLNP